MRTRAFTLLELLVVVAILAVLAALLIPVLARSKEQSKLTRCASRLHQVGLSLAMYRADYDSQAFMNYSDSSGGYSTAGRYRYPWNGWLPIAPYLKDGSLVWCLEPARDSVTAWNLYSMRTWTQPGLRSDGSLSTRWFFDPEGSRVVAYCGNHTTNELEKPNESVSGADLHKGQYPFVREDGSTGIAAASSVRFSYLWESDHQWHESAEQHATRMWIFPGETWPPSGAFGAPLERHP